MHVIFMVIMLDRNSKLKNLTPSLKTVFELFRLGYISSSLTVRVRRSWCANEIKISSFGGDCGNKNGSKFLVFLKVSFKFSSIFVIG
jgi:hypothetical protein